MDWKIWLSYPRAAFPYAGRREEAPFTHRGRWRGPYKVDGSRELVYVGGLGRLSAQLHGAYFLIISGNYIELIDVGCVCAILPQNFVLLWMVLSRLFV